MKGILIVVGTTLATIIAWSVSARLHQPPQPADGYTPVLLVDGEKDDDPPTILNVFNPDTSTLTVSGEDRRNETPRTMEPGRNRNINAGVQPQPFADELGTEADNLDTAKPNDKRSSLSSSRSAPSKTLSLDAKHEDTLSWGWLADSVKDVENNRSLTPGAASSEKANATPINPNSILTTEDWTPRGRGPANSAPEISDSEPSFRFLEANQ
jgi:hypothetical protein